MKIVNIVNIPNYPNYTIYGKDRETYINSALTIISCIRDAHKEIDIMGSCIVY